MNEPTIAEACEGKRNLEKAIEKLLKDYTERYHVDVDRVVALSIYSEGKAWPAAYAVEITATLGNRRV